MGWFRRKRDETEEIKERVFRRIRAGELVDRAISLRTLGRYDEALSTLKEARKMAPDYLPAVSVEANTLKVAKRWQEAKSLLLRELSRAESELGVPRIEWFAILGDIAWQHEQDHAAALSCYQKALQEKRPGGRDEVAWTISRSDVYASVAALHLQQGDLQEARSAAMTAVRSGPAVLRARRIYGLATVYLLGQGDPQEPPGSDLWEAVGHLEAVIDEQPEDYMAAALAGVACFQLLSNPTFQTQQDEVGERRARFEKMLIGAREKSEAAAAAFKVYGDGVANAMTHGFRRDGKNLVCRFDGLGKDGALLISVGKPVWR
jgi:tetratricopeptide (TPR) repeat protein